MALKIVLKPHERMIIGGAVVANGKAKCELLVENNVPILREKDILNEANADSPCRRIYFVVQLMYLDNKNLVKYQELYWKLVHDLVQAVPSVLGVIDQISEHILAERYYQALKLAKKLMNYEQEVLTYVRSTVGSLPQDGHDDHAGARVGSLGTNQGSQNAERMPNTLGSSGSKRALGQGPEVQSIGLEYFSG